MNPRDIAGERKKKKKKKKRACEGQQTRNQWSLGSVKESRVGFAASSKSHPATSPGRLRPGFHRGRERGEDPGLDWPHPPQASQQHHQAGYDLESTGEEKEGRPKNTWRRDTKAEMHKSSHCWRELKKTAHSLVCWRSVVDGLCSSWGKRPK